MLRIPDGVELVPDPSPADWVVERLRPWGTGDERVASFVPEGFEAYERILHPVWINNSAETVRWSTLAERRGRVLGPDTRFKEIGGLDHHASDGNLPLEQTRALAAVVEAFTSSPIRCWFCIWEGYGFWSSTGHSPIYLPDTDPQEMAAYRQRAHEQDEVLRGTPRVEAENRAYFLFRGPLSTADSFIQFEPWHQSPNLWWPDDRAWFVATEIYSHSTYVGSSHACLERILATPDLEAIEVGPDTLIDPGSD